MLAHQACEDIPLFPGQPTLSKQLDEMLRVDLAGEKGAKRIYEGQLWALRKTFPRHPSLPVIEHMYEQEVAHAEGFEKLVQKHHVRPTTLGPLWHVAGFGLGALSGGLGIKAAMACTVGVEEVIDRHYHEQIKNLPDIQHELKALLQAFREDELEHRDKGYHHGAQDMPFFSMFTNAVRLATRLAIGLSKRF